MSQTISSAALRAIAALCEEGSYSGAARALGVSHTAVAHHINAFEAQHGFCLFERERGRYRPTPFCESLLEISERRQGLDDEFKRLLARKNPDGQFNLRIGLGNSMPGLAIIGELIALHPNISVTVESGSHQAVMRAVVRREVDVGILPDVPSDARFRRVELVEQEVVALMKDTHPLAKHARLDIDDIRNEPLIFRSRGSSTQRSLDRAFSKQNFSPRPRIIADTRDAVYEAVSLGLGIGFMWLHGSHQKGGVARVPFNLSELRAKEVLFAQADERNPLSDMMFLAAERWKQKAMSTPARRRQ